MLTFLLVVLGFFILPSFIVNFAKTMVFFGYLLGLAMPVIVFGGLLIWRICLA